MSRHAVVVGINDYPGLSPLEGPCNDAREFANWVSDTGGVDPDHLHLLLSTDFNNNGDVRNAQPVSEQIKDMLLGLLPPNNPTARVGERLYIFVAGHGMSDIDRADSTALIAANASRTAAMIHHVVITDFVQYFRRQATFDEIVVIMDCCLDANVLRGLETTPLLRTNPHPNAGKVKLFLANATLWNKKAFEKDFDGVTRGIFSVALMEALEKAPVTDARVTSGAIENYIRQHLTTIAGDTSIEEPTFSGQFHDRIVFYERTSEQDQAASEMTIRVTVTGANDSEVVDLLTGANVLVDSEPVTDGQATFVAGAGIYKISVRGTTRSALIEVIENHEATL